MRAGVLWYSALVLIMSSSHIVSFEEEQADRRSMMRFPIMMLLVAALFLHVVLKRRRQRKVSWPLSMLATERHLVSDPQPNINMTLSNKVRSHCPARSRRRTEIQLRARHPLRPVQMAPCVRPAQTPV